MYALNLVKTAANRETTPPSGLARFIRDFAQSHDWGRVAPPTPKLTPRYYIDIDVPYGCRITECVDRFT